MSTDAHVLLALLLVDYLGAGCDLISQPRCRAAGAVNHPSGWTRIPSLK